MSSTRKWSADEQSELVISLVQSLRRQATENESLSGFAGKVFSSIHAELLSAQENAAILRILDVLNRVNSEIGGAIEYEDRRNLLSSIAGVVRELLDADVVVLYEIPETGYRLKARPGIAGTLNYPDLMLDELPLTSVIHQFLGSNQPAFLERVQDEQTLVRQELSPSSPTTTRFAVREAILSAAILPLMFANSRVGLMFVNFRQAQQFDEERKRDIREMGKQIALAMHNMRAYRRAIEFSRRLEKLFAIVDEITRHVTDKQRVLDIAIRGMVELIEAPRGAIVQWDSDKEYGEIVAEYHEPGTAAVRRLAIPKDSTLQRLVLSGEVCNIPDVAGDTTLSDRDREVLASANILSTLIVPIVDDQQRVVASIGVDEIRHLRAFSDKDINLCKILAGQIATATRLADSANELNQRVRLQSLQQNAMAILVDNDYDAAFEMIVKEGLTLIGASNGQLLRLNREKGFLETEYSSNISEIGLRYPLESSITGRAATTRKSMLIHDLDADVEAQSLYKQGYEEGMKSELAVPLIDRDGAVIGVLNAESHHANAFTTEHEQLWTRLAEGMVTVIRLADTIAEKNALVSLNEIQQRALSSQAEDLPQLLREILDRAMVLADATQDGIGQLLLRNGPEDNYLAIQQSTLPEDIGQSVHIDQSVSGIAIKRRSVVYVEDLAEDEDPEYGPYRDLHQWFGNAHMRSELVVPLLLDERAIGVINLEKGTTYAFTEQHARLVEVLASQAALIIQKSRLLQQEKALAERALQQRLEQQQNRDIANILHRLNNPLGAIRQYALLAQETLSEDPTQVTSVRSDLDKILESAEKTAILARDLRTQLRDVEAHLLDANELVRRIVQQWKKQYETDAPHRIEIRLALSPNLPRVRCGDKLEYVLLDLLNNAYEAVGEGQQCQLQVDSSVRGELVEISVTDNGSGIPRSHWELVFDESYSTKKSLRNADTGGIGLWWDRRYLRGYDGDVVISRSEINIGSTMTIRLRAETSNR